MSIAGFALIAVALCVPQSECQLVLTYGAFGVQKLAYRGVVLEDTRAFPSDAFHIWHMRLRDKKGKVLSGPRYGWGETNIGKTWDAATKAWTYRFVWGSINLRYAQREDALDMVVTETNLPESGVILDGASIYPLVLHFAQIPIGFRNASYPQLAFNTTGPSATVADFGSGEVVSVVPDAKKPLYSGFLPAGNGISYTAFIGSTTPDGLATFQPHNDRAVQPGETDRFVVSLRFAAMGTSKAKIASDAYGNWAKTWPPHLRWTDRRPIGTVYLASSPQTSDVTRDTKYANNPRRYFNDSNAFDFDVRTAAGLAAFELRVLRQAADNVRNLRQLGAQGAITWDIEGEQYPQNTSYVCAPDSIAQVAPEMEMIVADKTSRYRGMKLDDAYFKTMTDAGFRVGVCVRPQQFKRMSDDSAHQAFISGPSVLDELAKKIRFAHDRWGATLFYVDSSVEATGAALDASVFRQLAKMFPDSLLIPEESTPLYYAYTAPLLSFIFHGDQGTDSSTYAYYPHAFSVNMVNDVDPHTLAANLHALTVSVRAGDILMGHADYWQANDATIVSIYKNAGRGPSAAMANSAAKK